MYLIIGIILGAILGFTNALFEIKGSIKANFIWRVSIASITLSAGIIDIYAGNIVAAIILFLFTGYTLHSFILFKHEKEKEEQEIINTFLDKWNKEQFEEDKKNETTIQSNSNRD